VVHGDCALLVETRAQHVLRTVIPRSTTVPAMVATSALLLHVCPAVMVQCHIEAVQRRPGCREGTWVRTWHDVAALVTLIAVHGEQAGVVALLHHEEGHRRLIVQTYVSARRPDLRAVKLSYGTCYSLCCMKRDA
jgi:hypothetical protein